MARGEKLAIEYLSRRPVGAARVLEQVAPAEVSALISRTPARIVGPVLGHMLPTSAAQCVAPLQPEPIALLLQHMPAQMGAALLRHFEADQRERVFDQLSSVQTATMQFLLAYPVTAVGAWMEPRVLTLPNDCTVADALQRLQQSDAETSPAIWVLDRERRIRGAVPVVRLLRATPDGGIEELLDPAPALRARMPLDEAERHSAWHDSAILPVVNRRHEFVGMLRHADLDRARARLLLAGEAPAAASLSGGLAEIFGAGLAGLWEVGLELVSDRRNESRGSRTHEH